MSSIATSLEAKEICIHLTGVGRGWQKPSHLLQLSHCSQNVDAETVKHMPRGTGMEVDIVLFHTGRGIDDEELDDWQLEKEYRLRGLQSADPYSLAYLKLQYPQLVRQHPIACHWKNEKQKWCYAAFYYWGYKYYVAVHPDDDDWGPCWWFAGIPK